MLALLLVCASLLLTVLGMPELFVAAPEPEPVPVQEDIPKPVEIPTSNDNSDRKGSFCTGCRNFIPLGQRFCGICGQKNEDQEA